MKCDSTTLMIIAMSLTCLTSQALAADPARIEVRPGEEIGPVNRLIFGNNMLGYQYGTFQHTRPDYADRGAGIWDPDRRRPEPEFVKLARQAGTTVSRWPGGCGTHNYNWKLTVGPLEKRPRQKFGLPEFLTFCRQTDSVPILTVAVYWGTAADAAELVEYLNSPNDGGNPNGGTDWAAVRAGDGHVEPYNVVWFEYGNESNHGEHSPSEGRKQKRKFSAEEYARRYLEYQSVMKAVDPHIKLGAIIWHPFEDWNRTVLRIAGRQIDYGIEHTYVPGFHSDTTPDKSRLLMQACVASGARLQEVYDQLNHMVEYETGRTDLRWAVTEYNGHFVQNKPVPYRQSLGNALRNAEHLRVMMQPRNRIALANFWQFANEYWGMVRGYVHKGERPVKQANFYVYQLYNEHFGDTLIASGVSCSQWEFPGGAGIPARSAVPDLSVNAAKRADGTITLMIVNTNLDEDIETTVVVSDRPPGEDSRAGAWSLVGPTPWATNVAVKSEVRLVETPLRKAPDGWQITLPRHSLTAVEIEP